MTKDLEKQAVEMLESLTQSVIEGPADLIAIYVSLKLQAKNDPEQLKGIDELAKLVISRLPDLTSIVSDSTKVLETFLTFRASTREEKATENLIDLNKSLVKQNKRLAICDLLPCRCNSRSGSGYRLARMMNRRDRSIRHLIESLIGNWTQLSLWDLAVRSFPYSSILAKRSDPI